MYEMHSKDYKYGRYFTVALLSKTQRAESSIVHTISMDGFEGPLVWLRM